MLLQLDIAMSIKKPLQLFSEQFVLFCFVIVSENLR